MRTRWLSAVESLGASLWFVPSLLALLAVAAALALLWYDATIAPDIGSDVPWVFGGGPEGARSVLSAIASTAINVLAVSFSVTIVALALAAQQFTPLVVRQFVADRGNQVVLGGFIGLYLYSLIVLRSIRRDEYGDFVPQFAVTGGMLFALASTGLFIFFVHHIAASIQPSGLVAHVTREAHRLIDRLFPDELGRGREEERPRAAEPGEPAGEGATVALPRCGYVRAVDDDALMRTAEQHGLVVRLEQGVGEFVSHGEPLATIWPAERAGEAVCREIRRAVSIGRNRTMQQDPEFAVLQIASIAVKALSPSVNDPSTAILCVHYLGDVLGHTVSREIPSPARRDRSGRVRVIARGTDFARMADLCIEPIRRQARGMVSVSAALLDMIADVARDAPNEERRAVLRRHARLVADGAARSIEEPEDRELIARRARQTLALLGEGGEGRLAA